MAEYLFLRLQVTNSGFISTELNALAAKGWRVVSHADADAEYSFVLIKGE